MYKLCQKFLSAIVFVVIACFPVGIASQSPENGRSRIECTTDQEFPKIARADDEIRFVALGDTGRGCGSSGVGPQCALAKTMKRVRESSGFNLMFLLGDNVYLTGNPKKFPERLYRPYSDLANRGVLIKGVLGNHDVLSKKGSRLQMKLFGASTTPEQSVFFNNRPSDYPKPPPKDDSPDSYYTYSPLGNLVEFFALDSSMLTGDCCSVFFWKKKFTEKEKQDQISWLKKKLSESRAKWKVVLLHHPPYSSGKKHGARIKSDGTLSSPRAMLEVRRIITEAANETGAKIDLVLAGHEHFYERITTADGIRYFVSGAGSELREGDLDGRLPDFHVCGEGRKNSFMLFSVKPDSMTFWTIDAEGKPFDHGVIGPGIDK